MLDGDVLLGVLRRLEVLRMLDVLHMLDMFHVLDLDRLGLADRRSRGCLLYTSDAADE